MVEVYDSHEQSERVKGWLKENGSAMVMGLVLAFGGLFGFKQWQIWEQNKNRQASAEFSLMAELLGEEQMDAAVANFETLRNEFPDSAYTGMATLYMARARVESGQSELAVGLLEDAVGNAQPLPMRVIARARLARLKLDLGEPEAALQLLEDAPSETGFEARFAEIRGDIHKQMGNLELAAGEYNRALELQETGIGFRPLLEMKLESLGEQGDDEAES